MNMLNVFLLAGFIAMSSSASLAPSPATTSACNTNAAFTPELTEGPYYLDDKLFRSNVTEGQGGLPLTLKITVVDSSCTPLPNTFVDIWHTNATGIYSGYLAKEIAGFTGVDNTTFMRGITLTDKDGVATVETIVPGWYSGRAVHVHCKVHISDNTTVPDASEYAEYVNSTVAHTGQFFFDQTFLTNVYTLAPYTQHPGVFGGTITTNNQDSIYSSNSFAGASQIVNVTQINALSLSDGVIGTVTIKVDPTSSPAAVGAGGSGSSGGMTGMGPMPSGMGPRPSGMGPRPSGRKMAL